MLQDVELELNVLAAVVEHGKDGWIEISDIVKCETFYNQDNQVYFKCIEDALKLSDKVDKPLFLSSAHKLGLESIVKENKKTVDELFSSSSSINNIRINGKRLAKLEIGRISKGKLRTAISDLENITGEEPTNSILTIVEKPGFDIQRLLNSSEEGEELLGEGIEDYIEELLKNPNIEVGISTGMPEFDTAIGGGLRRGCYTLLGARPKTGKSSIALNIALFVASKLKIPVLFLDTEMKPKQHYPRMLANRTSIPINTIEHAKFGNNPLFKSQIIESGKLIRSLPITHQRIAGKDFDEVLSIIRRWVVKKVGFATSGQTNNCLVIYDYFKLMDAKQLKNLKEHEVLGYQASALHDFLGDYDIACLAFVQLNKEKDIAQSDRLIWLASSVAMLLSKTSEEMVNDGYENGNRKIIMTDNYMRYGEGLDQDDYINLQFNGHLCQMIELGKASSMNEEKKIGKAGYTVRGGKYDQEDIGQDEDEAPF